MDHLIGPYTDLLIKECAREVNKKENREKIFNLIIYPMISDVTDRYQAKIRLMYTIILLLIILLIATLGVGVLNYQCVRGN